MDTLTWNDIKTFTKEAFPNYVPKSTAELRTLLKIKGKEYVIEKMLLDLRDEFFSKFPDVPEVLKDILPSFQIVTEEDKINFKLDPNVYILSIFTHYPFNKSKRENRIDEMTEIYLSGNKELYIEKAKGYLKELKNDYTKVLQGEKQVFYFDKLTNKMTGKDQETVRKRRKGLNWLIRHLEEFYDGYCLELPVEFLLEIDQDKFLLYAACNAFTELNIKNAETINDIKKDTLTYIQNYILYTNEMKQQNPNYNPSFRESLTNKLLSLDLFSKQMELISKELPELLEEKYGSDSYDELVKTKLKDLFKQKRKEEYVKSIQMGWEFVPETKGEYHLGTKKYSRTKKTETEIKELESKKIQLLEEKKALFEGLPYIAHLTGKDCFEGYVAHFFPNKKVILEKFYKKTKYGAEPVMNEAIYVLSLDSFVELSKLRKEEIREYIKTSNDPVAKVICHFKNFQKKVLNEITGEDYTEEVLEYIDELVNQAKKPNYEKRK